MDDDEDFGQEASEDFLIDEYGPLWYEQHYDELRQSALRSNLVEAALAAHNAVYSSAKAQIDKATSRLETGDWDVSVFHASRALEGYLSKLFYEPFAELMLQPLRAAFPSVPVDDDAIFLKRHGLPSKKTITCLGIAAVSDDPKAAATAIDAFAKLVAPQKKGGHWFLRNIADHTLQDPTEEQARAFLASVNSVFDLVADALEKLAAERAEAAAHIYPDESWRL